VCPKYDYGNFSAELHCDRESPAFGNTEALFNAIVIVDQPAS